MGVLSPSPLKRETGNCHFIAGGLSRRDTEATPGPCGQCGEDGKKGFNFQLKKHILVSDFFFFFLMSNSLALSRNPKSFFKNREGSTPVSYLAS